MNIFVLDYNTKLAAQYHCDKHIVKMILETAQIMCTTANHLGIESPYKSTHFNHPCTRWARESKHNFLWLMELFNELHEEWQYRFGHSTNHLSYQKLQEVEWDKVLDSLPNIGLTPFAQAMPEQYSCDDAVVAYRDYYKHDKAHILKYTNTKEPQWLQH